MGEVLTIEEIKHAPDRTEREKLESELTIRRDDLLAETGSRFEQVDTLPPDDSGRRGLLIRIRQTLNATKYIQGLLRDLDED